MTLSFDWHYYKDSKAWLCKVAYKKKTIFWLSVHNGFFKTSFFFLQRHLDEISALKIEDPGLIIEKEWGKMIPFIFSIKDKNQLPDLLKMVRFKKLSK